jgi:peptidyl-prolyl cis-trans isomerase C
MKWKASNFTKRIFLLVFSFLFLAACNDNEPINSPPLTSPQGSSTPETELTATPESFIHPTTEPDIPLAATVNGQAITLAEYQAELERARAASDTGLVTYTEEDVLQNLIDEVLLAQGASEAGFIPDQTLIQTRLDQLDLDEQTLQDWLTANGYTQENFERAFARSIAAAWMRDQITSGVSSTAEQVHARQILLYNSVEAENALAQLQAGTDFATLAAQYDPRTLGDLGWFPRGYLTVPELDDPIFSLQPGEHTQIIETMLGFHIVQMIEREPQRPLSPGAFQTLQVQAVENWLLERLSQSEIRILVF